MNVLHLGKYYFPFTGGIETVTKDICEGLAMRGHSVEVLCSNIRNSSEFKNINNVKVTYSPRIFELASQPINLILPFQLFFKIIKADVIHVHSPNPIIELLCLLIPFKKIVTTHHADVVRQKFFLLFYKYLYKAFLKRCSKIFVATENHIRFSAFLPGFRDKCVTIPFTIRSERFHKSENVLKYIKRLKNEYGQYALFVGRLVSYKGLEYLIQAAKDFDGRVLIVGTGIDEGRLRGMILKNGLEEKVVLLGKVTDDEKFSALFHACHFGVLPSITSAENFGVFQIELMYCSKPVITTNIKSGVPIVGVDGETSLIVEPRNVKELSRAMNLLVNDIALHTELCDGAKKRFHNKYEMDNFLDSHEAEYIKLL